MSAHKARAKRALPSTPGRFRADTTVERKGKCAEQALSGASGTPLTSKMFKRGKSVPELFHKALSEGVKTGPDQEPPSGLAKEPSRGPSSKEQLADISLHLATSPERSALPRRISLKAEEGFPFINPEKKVARVLPMTPAFLENNTGTFCGSNDDRVSDEDGCFPKVPDKERNTKEAEANKWGKPFDVYTFDEEASSVRVAVRLRPFAQRYLHEF